MNENQRPTTMPQTYPLFAAWAYYDSRKDAVRIESARVIGWEAQMVTYDDEDPEGTTLEYVPVLLGRHATNAWADDDRHSGALTYSEDREEAAADARGLGHAQLPTWRKAHRAPKAA